MLPLNKRQFQVDFTKYPYPDKLRHHVTSHNYFAVEDLKVVPPNYPPIYKSLDWSDIFLNEKKPDRLDIGCGKGIFLLGIAHQNPDKNYLGIEVRDTAVDWINNYINGESVPNCRALFFSVANGIPFIESESIEAIYYLFPDPWPKNRHHKRRAFNFKFLEEIYRVLKSDGKLFLATDLDYVDEYQTKLLIQSKKFNISEVNDEEWNLPITNKESFCIKHDIKTFKKICTKINF